MAWYLMQRWCVSSRSSRASIPRARSMLPSCNEIGLGFPTIQEEYYGQRHASVTWSQKFIAGDRPHAATRPVPGAIIGQARR